MLKLAAILAVATLGACGPAVQPAAEHGHDARNQDDIALLTKTCVDGHAGGSGMCGCVAGELAEKLKPETLTAWVAISRAATPMERAGLTERLGEGLEEVRRVQAEAVLHCEGEVHPAGGSTPNAANRQGIIAKCEGGGEAKEACECYADELAHSLSPAAYALMALASAGELMAADARMSRMAPADLAAMNDLATAAAQKCGAD
jgi:hypothetical protein